MNTMTPSAARAIALQVVAILEADGYTVSPADVRYLTCVVLLLAGLTRDVRNTLVTWLNSQKAQAIVLANEQVAKALAGSLLYQQQQAALTFINTILSQFDSVFNGITPFLQNSECAGPFMEGLTDAIPIKIPATAVTSFLGLGDFDLFEGVTSYGDLKAKADELTWKIARATSGSFYAAKIQAELEEQTKFIDGYIEIINLVNVGTP